MKIVFLGYAISEEDLSLYSGASVAGNKMQLGILKELSKRQDVELSVITIPPVASFPKDRCLVKWHSSIRLFDDVEAIGISFINIPIIKQVTQIVSVIGALRKLVSSNTFLIPFNMYPEVGTPAVFARNHFGCSLCPILADLPLDPFGKRNTIKMLLRGIYNGICKKNIMQSDKIIVLNKNAAIEYAPGIPYIVVEGGIDTEQINENIDYRPLKKNIVYTGALTEYSGIINLMEAMKLLSEKSIYLDIYGDGPLKKEVTKCSANYRTICYHGKVSNVEAQKAQKEAWLLINPRPVSNQISMMTFPSKIMEYMMSGVPVLSTKLSGITKEYRERLFMTDDTPEAMAKSIKLIENITDEVMRKRAQEAFEYVIKNKNWTIQTNKIVEFLPNRGLET